MTASAAFAGIGTVFTWGGSPVAELTSIGTPSSDAQEIEVTNFDSDDSYREFIMGVIDAGTFDIEGNFVPTDTNGQIAMITDHQARTKQTWSIAFSDTGNFTVAGSGYCKTLTLGATYDGKATFRATIRVTGKATYTA
jgi:predicted secreted protein